ncbi:hypothetical protein [Clostridium formicaceticum]|uniref:Uncharacterized protein n=1 Tax=Clostridium formicaceticum TaxID=1497 RepID=A0AAC9WFT3_9CLOT|nr:hypothetical protein [Clostridium formicaceticum]AOY76665.1 hypothetical protein BJL90_12790 [Clostridium formicaceticum]ARE87091.1 hypothetical protein CLFO_14770 [Clostridium formicaceticum]
MKKLLNKVRIIKSSEATYWYAASIGIVLGVVGIWRGNYMTDHKEKNGLYMVDFKDCEIIEDKSYKQKNI